MASSQGTVAKRYSRALWLLLDKPELADEWLAQLDALSKTLKDSNEFQALVSSPAFGFEQKSQILRSIMEMQKTPAVLAKFLLAVLKAGRFEALASITDGFRTLVNEARNTVSAEVETALPMSESAQKRLADHLDKLLGKRLALKIKVVPDLVAGLRVKVGGKTLDFSFSNQLSKMERWLSQGQA